MLRESKFLQDCMEILGMLGSKNSGKKLSFH